jgi:hypothetical protein
MSMSEEMRYLRKKLETTDRFNQDLINQNERLSQLASEFETEKLRLQDVILALQTELSRSGEELACYQKRQFFLQRRLYDRERENYQLSKA